MKHFHQIPALADRFVCDVLSNDETSTDQELVTFFAEEIGISREVAAELVAEREQFLQEKVWA